MNRFIEVEQQKNTLAPIVGYQSYPLVSLNEALKPFLLKIDKAYKHCRYPSKHGLTRDEAAALLLYTMETGEHSFYRILNQVLCDTNRESAVPWFPFLRLFDSVLHKLPTVRGRVWRVASCDLSKFYQKNETVTWWGVSSCSSSIGVVQEFLGGVASSTVFMIEVVSGKNVAGYTMFPNEEEVILPMGTCLRVRDNALTFGQLHVIHLVEVDSQESPLPYPARWEANAVNVDRETNSLLICGSQNRRVMRWSRQSEIVIDNISCWELTMDK